MFKKLFFRLTGKNLWFGLGGGAALSVAPWWATALLGIFLLFAFPFILLKKVFTLRSSSNDPMEKLVKLTDDGMRAYLEKDIEHYKEVDKTVYELFLRFRQDTLGSVAEFTPEGSFARFKPNVTQDQIAFVVKQGKKMLERLLEVKGHTDASKQMLIDELNTQSERGEFWKEFDDNFGKVYTSEAEMRKDHPSKEGQKFVDRWVKTMKSPAYNRYLQTGSKEDRLKHYEENHPLLVEHAKKYGLKVELDEPDDDGNWPDGTSAD